MLKVREPEKNRKLNHFSAPTVQLVHRRERIFGFFFKVSKKSELPDLSMPPGPNL